MNQKLFDVSSDEVMAQISKLMGIQRHFLLKLDRSLFNPEKWNLEVV